jgi:hypothetical protein
MKFSPKDPHFIFANLPEEERERASFALRLIRNLGHIIQEFQRARELHAQCLYTLKIEQAKRALADSKELDPSFPNSEQWLELLSQQNSWVEMAARTCAMQPHEFIVTLGNLKNLMQNCPALRSRIDFRRIGAVFPLFVELFGEKEKVHKLRNAALHPADFFATPNKAARNSVDGPIDIDGLIATENANGMAVSMVVTGEKVYFTADGETHYIEMSRATVHKFLRLRKELIEAMNEPDVQSGARPDWLVRK